MVYAVSTFLAPFPECSSTGCTTNNKNKLSGLNPYGETA